MSDYGRSRAVADRHSSHTDGGRVDNGAMHLAITPEATIQIDAVGISMAIARLRSRHHRLRTAFVHISAKKAIAPVARAAALARVPQRADGANQVVARGVSTARVCTSHALVNVCAVYAVARVARWTLTKVSACQVGAVVGIVAVVRTGGALIDLRARGARRGIAAETNA